MIGLSIDSIRAGGHAQITRWASDGDISESVDAAGDDNPVHSARERAASTVLRSQGIT